MSKQTFPIPEGCKAISMETIGNTIVTTFEPAQEHPEFKRGDVLISKWGDVCVLDEIINENQAVEIVGLIDNGITYNKKPQFFDHTQHLRPATPEEAQRLWDALAKEGKRWNPETMDIEEIKKEIPRAKVGGTYWSFDYADLGVFSGEENGHSMDITRYKQGRYFLSEKQAQRAAGKLKQALADFWKEELK